MNEWMDGWVGGYMEEIKNKNVVAMEVKELSYR